MKTRSLLGCLPCALVIVGSAYAQRFEPITVDIKDVPPLEVRFGSADGGGGLAGSCEQQVSSHTDADFGGGAFTGQGGFAEQEIAAVSYTLPESAFPIKIELVEKIFVTVNATQPTETHWSILFWEGTPRDGALAFVFSSDGTILPHISLPAGTNGINVQVSVDPGDPDQIILNDDGSHTFSVGFRIDQHNSQTQDPCLVAPPSCCNAFPTTDVSGLASPSENWIFAVDCGIFGCPEGWNRFSEWPSPCRPSGDWVLRATWTSVNCNAVGACCLASGGCVDGVPEADCTAIDGTWAGVDTLCASTSCEDPSEDVPCCFESTGGCVQLSLENCLAVGGLPGPEGVSCLDHICFPEGAVCMPNGTCLDGLTPEEAAAMGGTFMGNGTTCATTTCPQPTGACCFANDACLELTEDECAQTGASWKGMNTTCDDTDLDGIPDDCVDDLLGDLNGDGQVNGADLSILLGAWGTADALPDLNNDGLVNGADLTILLSNWTG